MIYPDEREETDFLPNASMKTKELLLKSLKTLHVSKMGEK